MKELRQASSSSGEFLSNGRRLRAFRLLRSEFAFQGSSITPLARNAIERLAMGVKNGA